MCEKTDEQWMELPHTIYSGFASAKYYSYNQIINILVSIWQKKIILKINTFNPGLTSSFILRHMRLWNRGWNLYKDPSTAIVIFGLFILLIKVARPEIYQT